MGDRGATENALAMDRRGTGAIEKGEEIAMIGCFLNEGRRRRGGGRQTNQKKVGLKVVNTLVFLVV